MAGDDKRGPQANSKLVRESSAERRATRQGVVRKMDARSRQDTAAVDRWFDRQLNQLYADVISEPLPKEFLELIDKLREKTPK
jgi:hypothetical protein